MRGARPAIAIDWPPGTSSSAPSRASTNGRARPGYRWRRSDWTTEAQCPNRPMRPHRPDRQPDGQDGCRRHASLDAAAGTMDDPANRLHDHGRDQQPRRAPARAWNATSSIPRPPAFSSTAGSARRLIGSGRNWRAKRCGATTPTVGRPKPELVARVPGRIHQAAGLRPAAVAAGDERSAGRVGGAFGTVPLRHPAHHCRPGLRQLLRAAGEGSDASAAPPSAPSASHRR